MCSSSAVSKNAHLMVVVWKSGFWHRFNRRSFSEPAKSITEKILVHPRYSLSYDVAYLVLAFWFSGVMHLGIDLSMGIPFHESGAVRFFTIQALGITGEQVIMKALRSFLRSTHQRVPLVWQQRIGYCWVLASLSWLAPVYIYPTLLRTKRGEEESILPISVLYRIPSWT